MSTLAEVLGLAGAGDGGKSAPVAARRTPLAWSWADITCGEACWHAREEVCRCSCGGKNHGCLRAGAEGAAEPERTCRINGVRYKLAAVGLHGDLMGEAGKINATQYRAIEPARIVVGCEDAGLFTPEAWQEAKARAARERAECFVHQYTYTWGETDAGAPARVKPASEGQKKWREFDGWRDNPEAGWRGLYCLWLREEMPAVPGEVKRGRDGEPEADQTPMTAYLRARERAEQWARERAERVAEFTAAGA